MNQREYWAVMMSATITASEERAGDLLVVAGGMFPAALKKIGVLT